MENLSELFRKLAASTDAINFYLNHTTFGIFLFERQKNNIAQADKKLLHFLNIEGNQNIFEPNRYLNESSQILIKKLSKLKGEEINNQESFLLIWEVNGNQFQTTSYAYWLQSEDVVFIGLGETKKLSENSKGKYFNSRKQKEELRLFESIIKNTKDAILITEAEESVDLPGWKILFANSAFCEMTGYTLEELKGQTPKVLQGEKTDRKVLDKVRKSLKNWEPCEYNLINYKKNREEFWVNISLTPIADEKGWFTHWMAVERDITQQKEHEIKLREAKEDALRTSLRLSNLFNAMEDIVFEMDYNGTYINIAPTKNKDKLSIRPSEEVIGKTLHELFPKKQADYFLTFIRQCLDENKSDSIIYPLQFDDKTIWFEGRGTPMGKDRLLYIVTDITDRKRTEQELIKSESKLLRAKEQAEASEQRLKLAVTSAQLGIWEWDIIKDTIIGDDKTFELFGYDKGHDEITLDIWSNYIYEDDRFRVLKEVEDALNQKRDYSATFRIIQPNGKIKYLNEYGLIVLDKDDKAIRMIGVVRDVTAEKNKQLELLKAEKDKAKESEQRLQLAVDSAHFGVWEWNIKDSSFIWDERTCELMGHDKGEITYEAWANSLHKDDRNRVLKELEDALEGLKEYNTVYRVIPYKDVVFYVHVNANVLRDKDGNASRMVGVIRDITEKKINEENLAKQSNIQAFLVELASDFINIPLAKVPNAVNSALANIGNLFNVDRAYIFLYDWQKEITNNTYEWCAEGISAEINNLQEIPLETIPNWVETHKQGKTMLISDTTADSVEEGVKEIVLPQEIKSLITLPMMMGENCIGFIGFDSVRQHKVYSEIEEDLLLVFSKMLVNIEERTRIEEELYKKQYLFESAEKISNNGSWEWNLKTNEAFWSDGLYEIYGRNKQLGVPKIDEYQSNIYPEDWDKLQKAIDNAINRNEEYHIYYRIIRYDNQEVRILESKGEVFRDNNFNPLKFIGIAKDVTELKNAELALIKSKENAEKIALELSEAQKVAKLGSWYLDIATNKVTWSDELFNIYGYELGSKVPEYHDFEKIFTPESWARLTQNIQTAVETGKPYDTEFEFYRKDGAKSWMWAKGECVFDDKNEVIGLRGVSLDITERKKLELELTNAKERAEESENRFKLATDAAQLGIWDWDLETNEVLWDDKSYELIGLKKGDVHLSVENVSKNVHPDDIQELLAALETVLNSKEISNNIFRVVHPDGKELHIHSYSLVLRNSEGKPIRMTGTYRDVTEEKTAEDQLKRAKERAEKSEQRLKLATESAQLGIWDWDIKANQIIWDEKSYELLGLKKGVDNPDFETWSKTVHPDDMDNTLADLDAALKGKKEYNTTFRSVHPDGKELYINGSGIVQKDSEGNPSRMIGVQRDVTDEKVREIEIKQAKESAEESEQRLVLAAKSAKFGIWDWNMDNNQVIWDDLAYEIFGYDKDTDEGSFELWTKSLHPDDKDWVFDILKDSIDNNKEYNITHRVVHKNGNEIYVNSYGIVLKNEIGEAIGMVGIVRDITNEKIREIQLKDAKEKAEAASVAKSEFLANMSHEIRTPLNSVIGFSELLLETQLSNIQKDYIESVNYSANTLLDLVNDILDFSKIEAGKLELELVRTNLHTLLYQIIEMIKFKLNEKDIELLLYIAPEVPQFVYTDAVRIKQILVNLMGNAVKFTESGELELSVITLEQPKNEEKIKLRFGVRDTGIGISKAQQEKIFEAFAQEDTSITRKYGGTGLGLSISNQLLSLMESTLQLTSEQGKGSSFYFDINLTYELVSPIKDSPLEEINNILLIDDNARSLEIIERMFTNSNTKVEITNNGFDGLVKLQSNWQDYDAVLLDLNMPLLNGEEVAKKIRETFQLNAQQLPILLMCDTLSKGKCNLLLKKYSVKGCLQKPITQKELFSSLALLKNKPAEAFVAKKDISEPPTTIDFNGKSLLIVDDNAMNRKLANSILNKLFKDIELVEAENGKRALELAKNHYFKIILMDVQMPGMSGYETTKQIRSIQDKKNKPIIIALTAGTIKGERQRCLTAGMDDYMSKPVTISKLKTIIKKWIGNEKWEEQINSQELENSIRVDFNYNSFLNELEHDVDIAEEIINIIRGGSLGKDINKLNEAFKQKGGKEEIRYIAHKIKGVCLNLHLENLEESVSLLEHLYPHYYSQEATSLLQQINKKYQKIEKIIFGKEYL